MNNCMNQINLSKPWSLWFNILGMAAAISDSPHPKVVFSMPFRTSQSSSPGSVMHVWGSTVKMARRCACVALSVSFEIWLEATLRSWKSWAAFRHYLTSFRGLCKGTWDTLSVVNPLASTSAGWIGGGVETGRIQGCAQLEEHIEESILLGGSIPVIGLCVCLTHLQCWCTVSVRYVSKQVRVEGSSEAEHIWTWSIGKETAQLGAFWSHGTGSGGKGPLSSLRSFASMGNVASSRAVTDTVG